MNEWASKNRQTKSNQNEQTKMNILKFRIILHVGIFNKYKIQFAHANAISNHAVIEKNKCVNVLKSRKLHAYMYIH